MADEPRSSPLSSPPESVIDVAIHSPAESGDRVPYSADHQELRAETREVIANQPTASPKGNITADDLPCHNSDDGGQSSTQKRKASISRTSAPAKKARRIVPAQKKSAHEKKWEAPFVYTDPKAPLANADLRAILLHPDAWDILTPEEKRDVLAKFPDETHILDAGTANARPDTVSLRNDDNFRHDCARYCENIELGRHDEEWLRQAWTAHEKQKRGGFDEFLREQFEEEWEVELPREEKAEDGESKTSTPKSPSRRSSQAAHPAARGDKGIHEGNSYNEAGPPVSPTEAAQSNSKGPEPVDSSIILRMNSSIASRDQGEATSVVVSRPD